MNRVIRKQNELEELSRELLQQDVVALDTEFHGEKRYWPDLFLIQIAGSKGPVAIDPLEVDDLSPVARIAESDSTVKVIHSARNDIHLLMHHLGVEFNSVFDTQLAAAFLGFSRQTALSKLVRAECGTSPRRGHTLSDWSMRPLTHEQIDYALDDVRYLIEIYRCQSARLKEKGRLKWYREEAESLTDPDSYNNSIRKIYRKIKSISKIGKKKRNVLWALVKWRESAAEEVNKPRNYIVKDYILGAIAAMSPRNSKKLHRIRGLSGGFITRWGDQIIQVIADAYSDPPGDLPEITRYHSKPGVAARRDILRIFLKQESCRLGISSQLLLSKKLINALANDPPETEEELYAIEELSGWRKEALGKNLVSLLSGRLALKLSSTGSSGLEFLQVDRSE